MNTYMFKKIPYGHFGVPYCKKKTILSHFVHLG